MIDWDAIKYFNNSDFPEDGDLAHPKLITNLNQLRVQIGERIFPSPVKGALARYSGSSSSQHFVGLEPGKESRLSTGVDVFVEGIPMASLLVILSSGLFGGVGVYLHTNGPDGLPWIMFHLDARESSLFWFAVKEGGIQKYRYPQNHARHWRLFQSGSLYTAKKHGRV